jgi:membrane protease YdiL (CAAX protease family)
VVGDHERLMTEALPNRPRGVGLGPELALTALVLAFGATSQRRIPRSWQVPANLGTAVVSVGLAHAGGASRGELGLDPAAVADGLRTGAAVLGPTAAVLAGGLAVPSARLFFVDDRFAGSSGRTLAYDVLVRIPLATATAEELLFRSALFGLLLHRRSPRTAMIWTAATFGLWHLLPALRSYEASPAGASLADRAGGRLAAVAGTIGVTSAAGLGFAWLRLRSGSVAAPIVAHAGINAAALLGAGLAARIARRSRGG